jgi:sporulation protein YlmC with PRC-barrel domain
VRSLRIGEEVLGPDGHRLGHLERIVVDEHAHRVTHLVVGGRVVGVRHFQDVDGAQLRTDLDRERLRRQPEALPEVLGPPGEHWQVPGGYAADNFLRIISALIGQAPYVPPVHAELDLSAVHEIKPGSPVFSGRRHVGSVSQVLADDAGRVTSLVLRRPGVLGRRHLLPAQHVVEVIGHSVHVDLSEAEIEALPDHEEEKEEPGR